MNRIKPLVLAFTLATNTSFAAGFSGLDPFDAPAKNTNLWGPAIAEGAGQLVQTNGCVQFVTDGPLAGEDFTAWPWRVANAPWDRDWSVQADIQVPFVPLGPGHTAVGMGIVVLNSADPNDSFTMNLEQVRSGEAQMRNFFNGVDSDGVTTETSVAAPAESGSVRIYWNATNRILSAFWDGTGGADGYNWTLLNTLNPSLATNWNMTSNDSFIVLIGGYSEDTPVSLTDQVKMDNFYLEDVRRTALHIATVGTNVTLSWPGEAISFQLQSSLNVTGIWSAVGPTPSLTNGQRQVTVLADRVQFFRLQSN